MAAPHIPPRAPSRAGHRRPPLTRCHASRNIVLDPSPLPPQVRYTPKVRAPSDSDPDDSSDEDEPRKYPSVALPPLCPPSPDSPTSSSSSSSLSSSDDDDDDDDDDDINPVQSGHVVHDGSPPPPVQPPLTLATPVPTVPTPTTAPVGEPDKPDSATIRARRLVHRGMSKSALAAFRHFWHRRYARWSVWQDRVDYIDSIHDQDRLRAAPSYPPSPALPSSREMEPAIAPSLTPLQPWHVRFRRPVYNPHSKIFPRMGDLHALRTDPYCDWPDRAFIFFPTYSIHRNLYLHDVLEREREFNARKSEFKARRSPLSYAHASQHTLDGNDTNDITHDAASVYVTPPTSPAPKPDVGLPDISPKPWELDWRARWQVLMNQQPQPPQQLLVPNTHGSLLSPDPTLLQGWQTPLATSAIDNANQDVWDDSDDIDLPLDNPQTMYDLGNSIARGPTPTPAFAPTAAPVVRLPAPASGLKRTVATVDLVSECQDAAPTASTSAPAALQASSDSDRALELLCATMSEALKEIGPTSAAASAQGPPSADAQFVQEQESVPERPASPAPTFFFYDVEEEEDSFEEESGLAPFERSRAGGFDVDALLSAPPVLC